MVNPLPQKINLARAFVAEATALANAWANIQKTNQVYVKSGVAFAAGDFDGAGDLVYVDPTAMGTLITQLNAFVTWMNTSGNGDVFFKDAPGT